MLYKKRLSKKDKKSALAHKNLMGDFLGELAARFGGETTLNQLRIGHYVGLKSLYENASTSNTDIAKTLRIPRSTVSRIIADCIKKGWIIEKEHPEDGRKKMLVVPAEHPEADGVEIAFRELLSDFLEQYDAGEISKIDSEGHGF